MREIGRADEGADRERGLEDAETVGADVENVFGINRQQRYGAADCDDASIWGADQLDFLE